LGRFGLELRARPGTAARTAQLEIRACPVTLRAPWRPGGKGAACLVRVVEAREIDPPADVKEPLHWVLLTSWPVDGFDPALRVIKTYTRRELIEEYHKALKTGVGVEASELSTCQRLLALLGILAVVAVRLLDLKFQAVTAPDEVAAATVRPPGGAGGPGKEVRSAARRLDERDGSRGDRAAGRLPGPPRRRPPGLAHPLAGHEATAADARGIHARQRGKMWVKTSPEGVALGSLHRV
jgi:hypothetical protein